LVNKGRYYDDHGAKIVVKKVAVVFKNIAYERLYQRLETKESERVFKLAKSKERRTRDLGNVMHIKDEDSKVLVEKAQIKER